MANTSVTGRPYVDKKLGAMLSATLSGLGSGNWYVYLVFDRRGFLRYAGQSGALFSRFTQHKAAGRLGESAQQQRDDWVGVAAIACGNVTQARATERKLIHAFHPPDNRKCETPGCRHYLDGLGFIPASRGAVNKALRTRGIVFR